MYEIYDNLGNIVGYYDDNFLAYNSSQQPIIANGQQAIYDPNNNVLIDASAIPDATAVDPSTPPAGMSASDWVSLFVDAAPKVAAGISAIQLSQINIKRAQQGLAPLNPAIYAPQVGVGLNPQTQKLVMFGLLGVGAVMLLGKK